MVLIFNLARGFGQFNSGVRHHFSGHQLRLLSRITLMRTSTSALSAIVIVCLLGSVSGRQREGQEPRGNEVVPAGFLLRGGVASVVEGDVLTGLDDTTLQPLKTSQQLDRGQVVQVGSSGRAEVLLNPGCYLRLSTNTRAALLDLSRENLKVKIFHGSVIIEIAEVSDLHRTFGPYFPTVLLGGIYPLITVVTPRGECATMMGGIYRFDVGENGDTELKVIKGLAVVPGRLVKDGMRATLRDGEIALMKFDSASADAFDNWSRERAALFVRSNQSLRGKEWTKKMSKREPGYFTFEDAEQREHANDLLVVSAVEGLVSFAEPGAAFTSSEEGWKRLSTGVGLKDGDRVRTDEDSRVEILLFPTCYLHLSSNTEIVYIKRQDGGAEVILRRGSAVVTSPLDAKGPTVPVRFVAPQAEYEVMKRGVYRLNVLPGGESEMIVYEGGIKLNAGKIKEGEKLVLGGTKPELLPVDKEAMDSFDIWSRNRAAPLTSPERRVRDVIAALRVERAYYSGLWFFDQAAGSYTFVPGRLGFHSPYGGEYTTRFRDQRLRVASRLN
jgi:hypothetical protein